jgi:NAD(P)-dependent dehydrogenase (short-subunit alcohol dehydrogenase family)
MISNEGRVVLVTGGAGGVGRATTQLLLEQLLKRFATPLEVASLITYLVSDAASFMTGAILPVDGGHGAW